MPIVFYMDEQVSRKITKGLRAIEMDVLTVQEDGLAGMPDVDILDRASYLNRVVVTYDHHFLIEAERRLNNGIYFYGIAYITDDKTPTGKLIEDLVCIAKAGSPEDFMVQKVLYLPF